MEYEALKRWIVEHPSAYQKRFELKCLGVKEIFKSKSLVFLEVTMSNNEHGFAIVYRVTNKTDVNNWLFWIPTVEQLNILFDQLPKFKEKFYEKSMGVIA